MGGHTTTQQWDNFFYNKPLWKDDVSEIMGHFEEEDVSQQSWQWGSLLEWWWREWLIQSGDSPLLPVLPVVKEVEPSLQDVAAGVELREEKTVGTLMEKTWTEVVAPW